VYNIHYEYVVKEDVLIMKDLSAQSIDSFYFYNGSVITYYETLSLLRDGKIEEYVYMFLPSKKGRKILSSMTAACCFDDLRSRGVTGKVQKVCVDLESERFETLGFGHESKVYNDVIFEVNSKNPDWNDFGDWMNSS
jgi:hypothetical protein